MFSVAEGSSISSPFNWVYLAQLGIMSWSNKSECFCITSDLWICLQLQSRVYNQNRSTAFNKSLSDAMFMSRILNTEIWLKIFSFSLLLRQSEMLFYIYNELNPL